MRRNKARSAAGRIAATLSISIILSLTACAVPAAPAALESETATETAAPAEAVAQEGTAEADTALPEGQDAVALSEEEVEAMLDQVIAFRGDEANAELAAERLKKALEEDPSVTAWLLIPDTATDLPLYATDTPEDVLYYSTHGMAGAEAEYGSAYFDPGNTADFTDPNTILHGSAGGNGEGAEKAPFYSLLAFGDTEYFDEHPYIYICTPTDVLEYAVFITYEDAAEDLLLTYNCYDYGDYARMVSNLFKRRDMQMSIREDLRETVDQAWCVITLEAESENENTRYVMAVLTGDAKLSKASAGALSSPAP